MDMILVYFFERMLFIYRLFSSVCARVRARQIGGRAKCVIESTWSQWYVVRSCVTMHTGAMMSNSSDI